MRRPVILALPVLALLGGCQLLIGLDGGISGTGGSGGATTSASSSSTASASSSSSTTSSSSSSTTTSSGTGGMGTGGHGGMGTGGMTSSSSSSSSGAACDAGATCNSATECPDPMAECVIAACNAGCCGTGFVTALMPTAAQIAGDCKQQVCDGAGATTKVVDDNDKPTDQDACHLGGCNAGTPTQTARAAGTPCSFGGGKVCGDPSGGAAGLCVECNTTTDCAAGMVCAGNQCRSTVLILAASATGAIGAEYHPGGAWVTTSLGGRSTDELSIAFATSGLAVGVLRIPNGATASDQVWYAKWTAASAWTQAAAIDASTIFAQFGPSISAGNATAQLIFHGTDFKHYYASYDGTAWSTAQPVGAQSYGPTPAAIAALGADASIAYFDGSNANNPTAQDRVSGAWQSKVTMGSNATFTYPPALVAMTAGVDLMAVYPRNGDGALLYQTRTGTAWSAAAPIPGATTSTAGRPALAALPNGGAIVAFRGNDGFLYYATYTGGAWMGATPFSSPNVAVTTVPSLARGVGGATAEIAFIKADSSAYHARLVGNAWTAPASVGGSNLSHVAIAAGP